VDLLLVQSTNWFAEESNDPSLDRLELCSGIIHSNRPLLS